MAVGYSLINWINGSRTASRYIKPVATWYANLAGYRRMGLKYDDIVADESPEIQRALERLTPREHYDRQYRMKLASHASVTHKDLPKEQWVDPKEDVRYLTPHIEEVVKENEERAAWDSIKVQRK
ncbi:14 kDa subunit of cytochrome bd ubiquinol oxidase [Athelia psychrophila]|uniref:Cytochrome b-c1 complex subunit 7 n=1 Tax=Athelia psychrophila TaxID=1759441 RepID=A0A166N7R5_9AGAM|nr:14 kDa subunit of cytochrome bd ubiquinol oxidase [Fibularhizoctonia sp. CBS 109695]